MCGRPIPTEVFTSPQSYGLDAIDTRPYSSETESSGGRRPVSDTGSEARRQYLNALGGLTEDALTAADREYAALDEDWSDASDRLRDRRYELTHTRQRDFDAGDESVPGGSERALSPEGAAEVTELERAEFRLHRQRESARARRNELLAEHEESGRPLGGVACRWPEGACLCGPGGRHW
jgi:hypothetical protein